MYLCPIASLRLPHRFTERVVRAESAKCDKLQRTQAERLKEAGEVAEEAAKEAERCIRASLASTGGF